MAKQTIDGNNNIQVDKVEGGLHLHRRAPFMREDDPNVISCPFGCGELTWYDAEECWNCTRRVKDYFIEQDRKAQLKSRNAQIAVGATLSFGAMAIAQLVPASWGIYGVLFGIVGLCVTMALIKDAESLRRP